MMVEVFFFSSKAHFKEKAPLTFTDVTCDRAISESLISPAHLLLI